MDELIRAPDSGAMALLRRLASDAAQRGADPQAIPHPDHELLDRCDQVVILRRSLEECRDRQWKTEPYSHERWEACEAAKQAARVARHQIVAAGRLRATTPAGFYAKAFAVSIASDGAHRLAVSLAQDLLASAELRALLRPTPPESR